MTAPGAQITAAQNCGINCAQIATVPMNSVIDANVAASSMKIFNIAGLPRTQAPAFQISVSAIVPVGNCGFQKIGSGSVNVWLTYGLEQPWRAMQTSTRPSAKQGSVG